jgi:Ni,Fe-hydrogenase I cytochrome b subunit
MEWVLLLVLAVLVAMGLLAGQTYVTPKFAQLQSAQASYAGNVAVTAGFIFVALIVAGMLLHLVDGKRPVSV